MWHRLGPAAPPPAAAAAAGGGGAAGPRYAASYAWRGKKITILRATPAPPLGDAARRGDGPPGLCGGGGGGGSGTTAAAAAATADGPASAASSSSPSASSSALPSDAGPHDLHPGGGDQGLAPPTPRDEDSSSSSPSGPPPLLPSPEPDLGKHQQNRQQKQKKKKKGVSFSLEANETRTFKRVDDADVKHVWYSKEKENSMRQEARADKTPLDRLGLVESGTQTSPSIHYGYQHDGDYSGYARQPPPKRSGGRKTAGPTSWRKGKRITKVVMEDTISFPSEMASAAAGRARRARRRK